MAPKILRRILEFLKNLCILALHSHEAQTMVYVNHNTRKEATWALLQKFLLLSLCTFLPKTWCLNSLDIYTLKQMYWWWSPLPTRPKFILIAHM